jgi:hypothetical protein
VRVLLRLRAHLAPLLLLHLLLAAALGSCARDHGLGVETTTSAAGTGGADTGTTGSVPATGSSSASSSGSGTGGVSEPPGPTRVTVVNGVNDYDAIRICFLPYPGGDPAAKPWPAPASGLPFAHASVLDLAVDIPANTDIRPTILAGDLTQVAGKTCDQAIALAGGSGGGTGGGDAGLPPPIIAAALAVLPASVFTSEKSLLLAPIGCMGGPGHEGGNATLACGNSYTPSTPTVNLVALGMSRITAPDHLALQVVNASVALTPTDIGLTPSIQNAPNQPLATALPTGGIEPKPPFTKLTVNELGALGQATIKTFLPGQGTMFPTSSTLLAEAFQNGTVAATQLENDSGYVLVAVGSYPNIPAGPFWHKLTYSLIKANP